MEGKGDDADEAAAAAALVARFEAAATEATAIEALAQIAAHAEEMGANHFLGGPMAREAVNALAKEMKEKIAKEWTPAVAKALGAVLKALATMCDVCDKRPATHFCQDCDEYLCIPCNEMHGEHRKKKGHAVRALADNVPPTCPHHPRRRARSIRVGSSASGATRTRSSCAPTASPWTRPTARASTTRSPPWPRSIDRRPPRAWRRPRTKSRHSWLPRRRSKKVRLRMPPQRTHDGCGW